VGSGHAISVASLSTTSSSSVKKIFDVIGSSPRADAPLVSLAIALMYAQIWGRRVKRTVLDVELLNVFEMLRRTGPATRDRHLCRQNGSSSLHDQVVGDVVRASHECTPSETCVMAFEATSNRGIQRVICSLSNCPCRRETSISEPESSRTKNPPLTHGAMSLICRMLTIV
jgi:hypothetical protein